jgi:hypothetical protein
MRIRVFRKPDGSFMTTTPAIKCSAEEEGQLRMFGLFDHVLDRRIDDCLEVYMEKNGVLDLPWVDIEDSDLAYLAEGEYAQYPEALEFSDADPKRPIEINELKKSEVIERKKKKQLEKEALSELIAERVKQKER